MGKIDFKFSSKNSQSPVGCVMQGICGKVIRRAEPFALEDSPKRFCEIEMQAEWREKEKEQSPFFSNGAEFPHEFASVDARVVKNYESNGYGMKVCRGSQRPCPRSYCGCRPLIFVIAVYHPEYVESQTFLEGGIDILTSELPAV